MEQCNVGPKLDESFSGNLPAVNLALSPGLMKYGSADGTHYLSERVLVKMEVLCSLEYILKLQFGQDVEDEAEEGYETADSSMAREGDERGRGARQSTVRIKKEFSEDRDMGSDVDVLVVAAELSDVFEEGKIKMEPM
ncbi:hypothetical protein N0V85_005401 [Neurospora sp. IMI 360204]|nr:hypothetical protein N0V85_005401 [Neurospora sp. IMI 360204]